jgi:hypothetical protein
MVRQGQRFDSLGVSETPGFPGIFICTKPILGAAAKSEKFTSDVYNGSLSGWLDYLRDGSQNVREDDQSPMSEAALLMELAKLTTKMR